VNNSNISGILILHGRELFKHLWNTYPAWPWAFQNQASLGHPTLHGCQLFRHPWGILFCMAVIGCELFKHLGNNLSCMAASFSIISGTAYPAWVSAFQTSLGHPILHGRELFNRLWNNLS